MVRMRDVDLRLFQFDYDLTWAGILMESDGTVLGRYGAGSRDAMHYNSVKGLRKALERALVLHKTLEKNRGGLIKKRDKDVAFRHPRDLPNSKIRKIVENDTARKNCVHCHMVQEGFNRVLENKPGYRPSQVQSLFPVPEKLGVVLDKDDGLKVQRVLPRTGAEKAGIKVGDVISHINGQPLISIADFIWALRSVGDPGTASLKLKRNNKSMTIAVPLKAEWKLTDLSWRVSLYGLKPNLELWLERAPKKKRRQAKVPKDELALEVRGVFGSQVRSAGLRNGDIVVGVGPWHPNVGPKDFTQYIHLNYYKEGSKIPLTVKRGSRTLELSLKF